ncbi:Leucine rich repeat protein [Spraguea lophii 42_110]|uniref:Leucine rich repeat protein n=1 Tax=Spraguea lophii (strain 42_110) TaxID=1358809 RepID=S7XHG9_SPRLO|nr:Leucine rich repeat protein [Spraguea lophii 42_110]
MRIITIYIIQILISTNIKNIECSPNAKRLKKDHPKKTENNIKDIFKYFNLFENICIQFKRINKKTEIEYTKLLMNKPQIKGFKLIEGSSYKDIHQFLNSNTQIEFLHIEDSFVIKTSIYTITKHLKMLKCLKIHSRMINSVDIGHLNKLTIFDCSRNDITYISDFSINNDLKYIQFTSTLFFTNGLFDVEETRIENFELYLQKILDNIFKCKKVISLNLSRNNLGNYNLDYSKFKGKKLILGYNGFKKFPQSIIQLENLEQLDFGYNDVTEGYLNLTRMVNLKKLTITNCIKYQSLFLQTCGLTDLELNHNNKLQNIEIDNSEKNIHITTNGTYPICITGTSIYNYINSLKIYDYTKNRYINCDNTVGPQSISCQMNKFINLEKLEIYLADFTFFNQKFYLLKKLQTLQLNIFQGVNPFLGIENFVENINNYQRIKNFHFKSGFTQPFPIILTNLKHIEELHIKSCLLQENTIQCFINFINLEKLYFIECFFTDKILQPLCDMKMLKIIEFCSFTNMIKEEIITIQKQLQQKIRI